MAVGGGRAVGMSVIVVVAVTSIGVAVPGVVVAVMSEVVVMSEGVVLINISIDSSSTCISSITLPLELLQRSMHTGYGKVLGHLDW